MQINTWNKIFGVLFIVITKINLLPSIVPYITFYLADTFIQSNVQSSANQGHITTEHAR